MNINLIYPLITAVLWGLCYTSIEKIVSIVDKKTYIFFLVIISLIVNISTILMINNSLKEDIKTIIKNNNNIFYWFLLAISTTIVGNYMSILSVEKTNASLAASLEITYPFWCLLFGYYLLNSELNKYTIFGSIIIFIGVSIIILGSNIK